MSSHKCICHSTTDNQSIYFIQKVLNYRNLGRNFGTTEDCNKWSLRIIYCISKEINFFLHKVSNNCCIYVFCNSYVRAVCTVCCSECIVNKYVAKRSEIFTECIFILCLFCSVTCVFKEDNISIFHLSYCCFRIWSNNFRISCKFYFLSQQFAQSYCNRCQR